MSNCTLGSLPIGTPLTAGWFPAEPDSSNIAWLMRKAGAKDYRNLHAWSVSQRREFWATMVDRLEVQFREPFTSVLELPDGLEYPRRLCGKLNVVDSCFRVPDSSLAVIHQAEDGPIERMSVAELRSMAGRVANGLAELGLTGHDRIAIDMPMTVESVAIYLGRGGGVPGGGRGRQLCPRRDCGPLEDSARPAPASSPRILPFASASVYPL